MSTTPLTGTLVVCVAAAGVAAGALFLEARDDAPSPATTAVTAAPAPQSEHHSGAYGSAEAAPPVDDSADDAESSGGSLEISGFQFSPVTVDAGAEVTVVNLDDAPHTVTSDDGVFDTGTVDGGSTVTFTAPSEPGTYSFHCDIHPEMSGTLTVR